MNAHYYTLVYNSIKSNDEAEFHNNINRHELVRLLSEGDHISFELFWKNCIENDIFAKLVSKLLAKNS